MQDFSRQLVTLQSQMLESSPGQLPVIRDKIVRLINEVPIAAIEEHVHGLAQSGTICFQDTLAGLLAMRHAG